jgi:hypothetical protein
MLTVHSKNAGFGVLVLLAPLGTGTAAWRSQHMTHIHISNLYCYTSKTLCSAAQHQMLCLPWNSIFQRSTSQRSFNSRCSVAQQQCLLVLQQLRTELTCRVALWHREDMHDGFEHAICLFGGFTYQTGLLQAERCVKMVDQCAAQTTAYSLTAS